MNQPSAHRPSRCICFPPVKIVPPSSWAKPIYDMILSKCCSETIAPTSVPGSRGSPTRNLETRSTKSLLNCSYIGRSTKILDPHRHISPWFENDDRIVV